MRNISSFIDYYLRLILTNMKELKKKNLVLLFSQLQWLLIKTSQFSLRYANSEVLIPWENISYEKDMFIYRLILEINFDQHIEFKKSSST